jgi:hypothetical protein
MAVSLINMNWSTDKLTFEFQFLRFCNHLEFVHASEDVEQFRVRQLYLLQSGHHFERSFPRLLLPCVAAPHAHLVFYCGGAQLLCIARAVDLLLLVICW